MISRIILIALYVTTADGPQSAVRKTTNRRKSHLMGGTAETVSSMMMQDDVHMTTAQPQSATPKAASHGKAEMQDAAGKCCLLDHFTMMHQFSTLTARIALS